MSRIRLGTKGQPFNIESATRELFIRQLVAKGFEEVEAEVMFALVQACSGSIAFLNEAGSEHARALHGEEAKFLESDLA